MLIVIWDFQGILSAHFQKHGEKVNSASNCEVLFKLQDEVHRKRPGQLARGVLLQYNNARPRTARITHERIRELECKLLEHLPYSPDLAPSDFHLSGPLKNQLGGKVLLMKKRLKQKCRSG
jgi:histone-lysine N-methyltransferase SETMAR